MKQNSTNFPCPVESFLTTVLGARLDNRQQRAVDDFRNGLAKAIYRYNTAQPDLVWTRGDWTFETQNGSVRADCSTHLSGGRQVTIDRVIRDAGCAIVENIEHSGCWIFNLYGEE